MQQLKLFRGVDNEMAELERQINRWMRKSGARILNVTGNLASNSQGSAGPMNSFVGGDILVIVLYEIDAPKKTRSA